jgi:hypothetical protein
MVEPQVVVLVVAGSSPVDHPFFKSQFPKPKVQTFVIDFGIGTWILEFEIVSVAQLDRAADFGSAGWGFESLQARTFSTPPPQRHSYR